MLTKEIKDQLREQAPLTDIVRKDLEAKGVEIRQAGGEFRTVCPFESGSTNSSKFRVSQEMFYCYSCGKSGDVFKWYMEFHGLEWIDAVKAVAAHSGMDISQYLQRRPETREEIRARQVSQALGVLAALSQATAQSLPEEEQQIGGISVRDMIASQEIGLLPDAKTMRAALDQAGIGADVRKASGLTDAGAEFSRRWVFWAKKKDVVVAARLWGRPGPVVGTDGAKSLGFTNSPRGDTPEQRNRGTIIATTDQQYLRLRAEGVTPVVRPVSPESLTQSRQIPQAADRSSPPVLLWPQDATERASLFPAALKLLTVNPRLRSQEWNPSVEDTVAVRGDDRYAQLADHAGTLFDWQIGRLLAAGALTGAKQAQAAARLTMIIDAVADADALEKSVFRLALRQGLDAPVVEANAGTPNTEEPSPSLVVNSPAAAPPAQATSPDLSPRRA